MVAHLDKTVEAQKRELKGYKFRKANRELVPGVVYGNNQEPISIAMDGLTLNRIFDIFGHSTIFDLKIAGEKNDISVLLHRFERHPKTNEIIHFDLYAVTKGQKLKTEISVHFEGTSPAEADSGKLVTTILDTIEIEALPKDLPDQITVDISDLEEVGDTKYVKDIKVAEGITILTDEELALIKVNEARVEELDPEPVEGEAEEESESSEESDSNDGESDQENTEENAS